MMSQSPARTSLCSKIRFDFN